MALTKATCNGKVVNIMDFQPGSYYLLCNGKLIHDSTLANINVMGNYTVHLVPRVLGGKGGFGSMLRAIGAQIEKTTNRDACRDLSGRRLRDINEEQRLKRWFAKQKERDEEKVELKKKKLERLRQICDGPALPKMEDKEYNRVRAEMADSVFEAVEKGFEAPSNKTASCTATSSSATSSSGDETESNEPKGEDSIEKVVASGSAKIAPPKEVKRKLPALKKTMLDDDLDSDVSSSDSEDDDSKSMTPKKIKIG